MADTFNVYNEKNELVGNGTSPVEVQKLTPATKYSGWKITRKVDNNESEKAVVPDFETLPDKP